ncbi:hypothetical protein D9M69_647800 [compost metagenome]
MGLTQHGFLAGRTFLGPARPVAQLASGFPFGRNVEQQFQSFSSIRNNTEVRCEHTANLGGFNIDMDELAVFFIGFDIAGMAVCPAVSDAYDGI